MSERRDVGRVLAVFYTTHDDMLSEAGWFLVVLGTVEVRWMIVVNARTLVGQQGGFWGLFSTCCFYMDLR